MLNARREEPECKLHKIQNIPIMPIPSNTIPYQQTAQHVHQLGRQQLEQQYVFFDVSLLPLPWTNSCRREVDKSLVVPT